MLAIGTGEGTVLLVDAASGEERLLVGHVGKVCSVALSPDGRAVASAGEDRSWNLWDVASGEHRVCSRVHDGRARREPSRTPVVNPRAHPIFLEVSPYMSRCTCLVRPGKPTRFDSWCPEWLQGKGATAVTFSPCSKNRLKIATGGRTVTVWDVQTGVAESKMRWPASAPAGSAAYGLQGPTHSPYFDVHSLSFTSDGLRLAGSKCGDAAVFVWDVLTGALLRTLPGEHRRWLHSVHFSPGETGRWLACSSGDGVVRILDGGEGEEEEEEEEVAAIDTHVEDLRSIAWSRDGARIACGGDLGCVVWGAGGGGQLAAMQGHDGRGECKCLRRRAANAECRVTGHRNTVVGVAYSPDGESIATGSLDRTCKVWDAATGALQRTVELGASVCSLAFGRDWVRDEKCVAFAMGQHARLGAGSWVRELEPGVVRMVVLETV